jgi:hypothetical protein
METIAATDGISEKKHFQHSALGLGPGKEVDKMGAQVAQ